MHEDNDQAIAQGVITGFYRFAPSTAILSHPDPFEYGEGVLSVSLSHGNGLNIARSGATQGVIFQAKPSKGVSFITSRQESRAYINEIVRLAGQCLNRAVLTPFYMTGSISGSVITIPEGDRPFYRSLLNVGDWVEVKTPTQSNVVPITAINYETQTVTVAGLNQTDTCTLTPTITGVCDNIQANQPSLRRVQYQATISENGGGVA